MDVPFSGIARLVSFIDRIEQETYPEAPSDLHSQITAQMLATLPEHITLPKDAPILDIGCGQGPALDIFREKGFSNVTGITLNDTDVAVCTRKGHRVLKMDQSFLDFPDQHFSFVWARHVIEHSIFPYFTLAEFARVIKKGGFMYLEVPAPETSCHHETNPNHYSVLNKGAWVSLLGRCGFNIQEEVAFRFTTGMGPDEYWGFICAKP